MDITDAPSLPVLGTTWVRRGPAYWWRRLIGVVGSVLTAAVILAIVAAVLYGIRGASRIGFVLACVVLAVVTGFTGWRTWRRRHGAPTRRRDRRSLQRIAVIGGPAVIVLLLLAVLATTVFQAVLFVLVGGFAGAAAGPLLVLVGRSLGREIPVEQDARVALGLPAPGDPGRAAAVSALFGV